MMDPLQEYEAAKNAVVLTDVSQYGKLLFRGPDRHTFLQALVTNDIDALGPFQGLPSLILTPKGKLVADFWFYNRGEDLFALQHPMASTNFVSALSRFLPLSKTKLEDVSGKLSAFYLMGPKVPSLLAALFGVSSALLPNELRRIPWEGNTIELLSYPWMSADGVVVLSPLPIAKKISERLLLCGAEQALQSLGTEAWEMLRIEAGVPQLGVDMDETTLPLEISFLERAISFTKGCYMGQETMARIKNLGHVNRLLVGLKLEVKVELGAAVIFEGKPVGKITSVAYSPRLNSPLALAMIRAAHVKPGTKLKIPHAGSEQDAVVVELPL